MPGPEKPKLPQNLQEQIKAKQAQKQSASSAVKVQGSTVDTDKAMFIWNTINQLSAALNKVGAQIKFPDTLNSKLNNFKTKLQAKRTAKVTQLEVAEILAGAQIINEVITWQNENGISVQAAKAKPGIATLLSAEAMATFKNLFAIKKTETMTGVNISAPTGVKKMNQTGAFNEMKVLPPGAQPMFPIKPRQPAVHETAKAPNRQPPPVPKRAVDPANTANIQKRHGGKFERTPSENFKKQDTSSTSSSNLGAKSESKTQQTTRPVSQTQTGGGQTSNVKNTKQFPDIDAQQAERRKKDAEERAKQQQPAWANKNNNKGNKKTKG